MEKTDCISSIHIKHTSSRVVDARFYLVHFLVTFAPVIIAVYKQDQYYSNIESKYVYTVC